MGDVALITQYIKEDSEIVNCRTFDEGTTPLLLAVASKNVDAVEALLSLGANPNMGDDDCILPVFAACGYTGQKGSSPLVQTPPPPMWVDMLKILVRHGASVHDIVGDSTMTTMTLACDRHAPDAFISYLRLLKEEQYADFDISDENGKSALYNAIRDGSMAVADIEILNECGVRIMRIFPDGRTVLHVAAEMAQAPETLEYLLDKFEPEEVNRLDQWGWSPLHYAVWTKHGYLEKIAMLLQRGADPYCKGNKLFMEAFHTSHLYSVPVTPIQVAAELLAHVPEKFESFTEYVQVSKAPEEDDDDDDLDFCDAEETQSNRDLYSSD